MNNIEKIFSEDPIIFTKEYVNYLVKVLNGINPHEVAKFIQSLLDARESGATIFFMGNGGSAATASHFANDLAIGTNSFKKPFRALSITDNNSIITAIANDFGYSEIFDRQLQALGKRGDVVVGISASGNSQNLLKAFDSAMKIGIKTIAITAFDGGEMRTKADVSVHIPTELREYGPAEDIHMILDHLIGSYLNQLIRRGH